MSMQQLSVDQVTILTILYNLEFVDEIDIEETQNETNEDRFNREKATIGWGEKEFDDVIEELRYWGYINENCNLTVLGRQYLKTGPDFSINGNSTKNYNITLFEKLAEIKGIEANFSSRASIFESLSNIFNWSKE